MLSASAISGLGSNLSSSSSTSSSSTEQIAAALQALSVAIQSGNQANANAAMAAIENALTSNPGSATTAIGLQALADLSTMSQALGSGNSTAINSAFGALQKDLTTPVAPALPVASAMTPAYVLDLLSLLPDSNFSSSSATTDVGFNLLAALSTQEAANTASTLNLYA